MYQFFVDITKALRTACISSLLALPKPQKLHTCTSSLRTLPKALRNAYMYQFFMDITKTLRTACISFLWTLSKPLQTHKDKYLCYNYPPPPPSLLYKTLDLITSWRQNVPSGGHGKACQGRQCSHEATIKKGVKMGKGCYQICWSSNLIIQ